MADSNTDPLKPETGLLVKLGSIIVHAQEMTEPGSHQFDTIAFKTLLVDTEVKAWLADMDKMAFLPKKRR